MARDMTPVLKRCRSLDLDPVYLGIDKKSKRNARANMDSSCVRNRKQNSSTEFWRNLSVTILHAHRS